MSLDNKVRQHGCMPEALRIAINRRPSAALRVLLGGSRRKPRLVDLERLLIRFVDELRILNMEMILDLAINHNGSAHETYNLMTKAGYR